MKVECITVRAGQALLTLGEIYEAKPMGNLYRVSHMSGIHYYGKEQFRIVAEESPHDPPPKNING